MPSSGPSAPLDLPASGRRGFRGAIPLLAFVALFVVLAGVRPAAAESELESFFAYRFGGLELPTGIACGDLVPEGCPDFAETEDGIAWGLGVGMSLREPWWLTVRFSQQSPDLDSGLASGAGSGGASWDRYLVGLEHRWGERERWRPFFSFAGGWTDASADLPELGTDAEAARATVELGGGVLVDHGRRLGARVEARISWTPLPEELGGDLVQVGVGLGLRLRVVR